LERTNEAGYERDLAKARAEIAALMLVVETSDAYIDELQYDLANGLTGMRDTQACRDSWDAARAKLKETK
jgi:hypothetical protein